MQECSQYQFFKFMFIESAANPKFDLLVFVESRFLKNLSNDMEES